MNFEIMEKINSLKETCRLLETDIQELTSEIIELEISRENLTEELKKARKTLYKEIEKNEQDKNKSQTI